MKLTMKKLSAWLLLTLCMSTAFAEPGQRRAERQAQRHEQRMERHVERGQDREARPQDSRGQEARPEPKKSGKMSPEERSALRRQINDAGRDIYTPNR